MSSMRSSTKRILAGVAALALGASAASAAPLVQLQVLGSTDGTNYSNQVTVSNGTAVQFKVVASLAPVGTFNAQANATIATETAGTDGMNSLKFSLNGPTTITGAMSQMALGTGWNAAAGTQAGTPTGTGDSNIFAGIAPGAFLGINSAPQTVLTGTFTVGTASATDYISPASFTGGSFKYNGTSTKFITATTEANADPYVGLGKLTLNVPEPASLGLLGVSVLGLLARRRQA